MQSLITHILDFIFPPSTEALRLRALSPLEMEQVFEKAEAPPFPFITSLFSYKDPLVKEMVLSIKYKKDRHAFESAAQLLLKVLLERAEARLVLIPIPISKKRRRARGFNQCEILIDELCKLNPDKFEKRFDILARVKDGGEQKLKNRIERLQSAHTFSVKKVEYSAPIIIIDDVVTTGSTLKEARDSLLAAHYTDVTALTLAH